MKFYIYSSLGNDYISANYQPTIIDLMIALDKEKKIVVLENEDSIAFEDAIEFKKCCEQNPARVPFKNDWKKVTHIFSIDLNSNQRDSNEKNANEIFGSYISVNLEPNIGTKFVKAREVDADELGQIIAKQYINIHGKTLNNELMVKSTQSLEPLHQKNLLIKYFKNELSNNTKDQILSNREDLLTDVCKNIPIEDFESMLRDCGDELKNINKHNDKKYFPNGPEVSNIGEDSQLMTDKTIITYRPNVSKKHTVTGNPEITKKAIESIISKYEIEEYKKSTNIINRVFLFCVSLIPLAFCKNYYNRKVNKASKNKLPSVEKCIQRLLPPEDNSNRQVDNHQEGINTQPSVNQQTTPIDADKKDLVEVKKPLMDQSNLLTENLKLGTAFFNNCNAENGSVPIEQGRVNELTNSGYKLT